MTATVTKQASLWLPSQATCKPQIWSHHPPTCSTAVAPQGLATPTGPRGSSSPSSSLIIAPDTPPGTWPFSTLGSCSQPAFLRHCLLTLSSQQILINDLALDAGPLLHTPSLLHPANTCCFAPDLPSQFGHSSLWHPLPAYPHSLARWRCCTPAPSNGGPLVNVWKEWTNPSQLRTQVNNSPQFKWSPPLQLFFWPVSSSSPLPILKLIFLGEKR